MLPETKTKRRCWRSARKRSNWVLGQSSPSRSKNDQIQAAIFLGTCTVYHEKARLTRNNSNAGERSRQQETRKTTVRWSDSTKSLQEVNRRAVKDRTFFEVVRS